MSFCAGETAKAFGGRDVCHVMPAQETHYGPDDEIFLFFLTGSL